MPQSRELKPGERETAHSLESLPLIPRDKIFLLLVWRGLKTASPVFLPIDYNQEMVKDLQEKVMKAGLFLKPDQTISREKRPRSDRIYFIANNQKDLKLISKLWFGDHFNNPKVYREIGRMSGFPKTAIETFNKFTHLDGPGKTITQQKLVLSVEEKKKLIPPELFHFSLFFYMSRASWQTELQTIKKWADEIKLVAPTLQEAYVHQFDERYGI